MSSKKLSLMKKTVLFLSFFIFFIACKQQEKDYVSFGEKIQPNDAYTVSQMSTLFENLKAGDTVPVKFTSTVNEVCQSKGCWMKLNLGEQETMVKFKDYAFFMPKNIAGHQVIVDGIAFVNEMSVDEQRHYAEDAGKSEKEIEAIKTPKRTLSFEASGVLVQQ